MKISQINNYINPKATGYVAVAGYALAMISGISKNKAIKKIYKPSALFALAATAVHLGQVEYNHHKWKSEKKAENDPKQL